MRRPTVRRGRAPLYIVPGVSAAAGPPPLIRYVLALCDVSNGAMVTFKSDELARSPKVCGCEAPRALKEEMRRKLAENLDLAYDGSSMSDAAAAATAQDPADVFKRRTLPWNVAVASRFDTRSSAPMDTSPESVAQAKNTCVVAFEREDWRWLEDEFGLHGQADVPMQLVKMLHKYRLVPRYDVLYPVDRATMRIWTLPEASVGAGADGAADVQRQRQPHCQTCGEASMSARLMRCSGCFTTRYCSKECQRANFAAHRDTCKCLWEFKEGFQAAMKNVYLADMRRVGFADPSALLRIA